MSTSNISFTKEDQECLETYLRESDPELFRFTRYMYYAFIRPKELRNLKIKNVRSDEKVITIPGEVAKNRRLRSIHVIRPLVPFLPEKEVYDNYLFGRGLQISSIKASTPLEWKEVKPGLDHYEFNLKTIEAREASQTASLLSLSTETPLNTKVQ